MKEEFVPNCSPMGSCFGYCSCLQKDTRPPCTVYFNGNNVVEFDNLVDNMETLYDEPQRTRFQGLSGLLSLRRAQRTPTQRLFLEMTETTRQRDNSQLCLIQTSNESLQILDARILASRAVQDLPSSTRPSTPGSSFIELEWELEGVSGMELAPMTSSLGSPPGGTITQECSRVSSPPSLEWDLVDCCSELSPPCTMQDAETEQLISEIERLTQRALQETGFSIHNNNQL